MRLYLSTLSIDLWARIYRRSFIGKARFPEDINFCEDKCFNLNIFTRKENITVCIADEKLYNYYDRDGSLTHTGEIVQNRMVTDYILDAAETTDSMSGKRILINNAYRVLFVYRYLSSVGGGITDICQKNVKRDLIDCVGCRPNVRCL